MIQHIRHLPLSRFTCLLSGLLILSSSFSVVLLQQPAKASGVSGWQAGNIISDAVMVDKSSMSTSHIQSFLSSKVPSCDTNGQKISEYGGPDLNGDGKVQRWEWGKKYYNQTKFTCLKNYKASDGRTAAKIIYDTAHKYSINPRVLIVLLQKEQGLVTDTWPLNIQYKTATGYGCPDTAPCDSQYYGLTNQLDWAAKMYRAILDNSPTWYTPYELGKNYIQYNPDSSCGGSTVNIQNRATQALYNYTPYQPNKATLNAGWGTATCGAYGNRNFYLYFTSWFGPTRSSPKYTTMADPRWMRIKNDTRKVVPYENTPAGSTLPEGQEIYFSSKITINGVSYLRTKHDTDDKHDYVIPLSDIEEIPVNFVSLKSPRWMKATKQTKKVDPITGTATGSTLSVDTAIYPTTKFSVGGETYVRTEHDKDAGNLIGIPLSSLTDTAVSYRPAVTPRWLRATTDTSVFDLEQTNNIGSTITKGTDVYANYVVVLNGKSFIRSSLPSNGSEISGIPMEDMEELPLSYTSMKAPRWMKVSSSSTHKLSLPTGAAVGVSLPKDTEIQFSSKITVDGQTYLRTKHDSSSNNNTVILLSDLGEVPEDFQPLAFTSMKYPRAMKTASNLYKQNPRTLGNVGSSIATGTEMVFGTKISIGGKTYLRTTDDAKYGIDWIIPIDKLQDI